MKTRRQYLSRALLTASAFALMNATGAFASTPPCTEITNTATVAYKVGTVDQTPIASDINDPNSRFIVGVKVFVSVANQDAGNITATPGTTPAVLKFEVENTGNGVHDYALEIESTTTSPHNAAADTFDGTDVKIYVDANSNGNFDLGTDTQTTTIDNLARDTGKIAVFVVYTPTDLSQPNGAIAAYNLKATALWADGSPMSENVLPAKITVTNAQQATCTGQAIDVVFGDDAGTFTGDALHDATHSDDSAFIVSSANISVTKGFTVVSDPVNIAVNPKAIPGAVVRYSIAIANTGTASALLSTISDALANTLQIIPAGATWAVTPVVGSSRTVNSGTLTADANAADGLVHTPPNPGGTVTATMTTILAADVAKSYAAGELKAGETLTFTFDATVQ